MKFQLHKIVKPLLSWYDANARVLPWRDNPTPYRVWVSEIMLQQTRVEAVKPYFERFTAELPSVEALAAAPEEQLLKLWEGLGYYSRVRNLQKAAQIVMEQYGGILPDQPEELLRLPGIGEYTAGAVASIAYGRPAPAVDGNVLRVLSRVTASREPISDLSVKRGFAARLREIYPTGRAGAFTQSLMELGATVCVPNAAPNCGECPLSSLCMAHAQGIELQLPIKAEKKKRISEELTVFLIVCENKTALRKRPAKGLLAGLWEFPNVSGKLSPPQAADWLKTFGLSSVKIQPLPESKHIFTHREWHMTNYRVTVKAIPPEGDFVWADREELAETYTLPTAFQSCLHEFLSGK
ncbi:A/G-specific adenine glycosylase [Caproiciproducens faecalis]|uniref:Adenine DNA glycosylase n=1 Tax=Caproiciproducens faecalis TaxID=2820301 RepID=A0ABS7DNR0_9FIRM|nr:A/G-specific adenine glycosylase [Caproiciproducens faecalis]MBW7572843.1 A/G-specific adenine glycosylase [Caproiciproducens faecalis]